MYSDDIDSIPISPVMESAEKLAEWLADNNVLFRAFENATKAEWLKTINESLEKGKNANSASTSK